MEGRPSSFRPSLPQMGLERLCVQSRPSAGSTRLSKADAQAALVGLTPSGGRTGSANHARQHEEPLRQSYGCKGQGAESLSCGMDSAGSPCGHAGWAEMDTRSKEPGEGPRRRGWLSLTPQCGSYKPGVLHI